MRISIALLAIMVFLNTVGITGVFFFQTEIYGLLMEVRYPSLQDLG